MNLYFLRPLGIFLSRASLAVLWAADPEYIKKVTASLNGLALEEPKPKDNDQPKDNGQPKEIDLTNVSVFPGCESPTSKDVEEAPPADLTIVHLLETLLVEAKQGQITTICAAYIKNYETVGTAVCGCDYPPLTLGAVQALQIRLNDMFVDEVY